MLGVVSAVDQTIAPPAQPRAVSVTLLPTVLRVAVILTLGVGTTVIVPKAVVLPRLVVQVAT
jgi:hypothetical protein